MKVLVEEEVEVKQLLLKRKLDFLQPITVEGVVMDSEKRKVGKKGGSNCITIPQNFAKKLGFLNGTILEVKFVIPQGFNDPFLIITRPQRRQ